MSATSTKMLKRVSAALCLTLAFAQIQVTTAQAAGCSSEMFASGSGTENDPYMISTVQQLENVRNCQSDSLWFKQSANLDLSSVSPWQSFDYFQGHYDGNNLEISNILLSGDYSYGIFGLINNGSVKDLQLEGTANFSENSFNAGMLAGRLDNSSATNIKVTANVTSANSMGVNAGVIGYVSNSSASDIELSTISEDGVISLNSWISGGVIGYVTSASNVSDIALTGTVENNATGMGIFGGAIGYLTGSTASNVSVTGDIAVSSATTGGIVGYVDDSSLSDATHTGEITFEANEGFTSVGGVTGYFGDSTGANLKHFGNISAFNMVGGIAGNFSGSTIDGAVVSGNISGEENVGGLIGRLAGQISNASYTGEITGLKFVGGISGYCSSNFGLDENFNFVETNGAATNVEVLTNISMVAGRQDANNFSFVGGVFGYTSKCNLENVAVTGNASGFDNVGGISGYASESSFEKVFSNVNVSANGDFAGGFLGYGSNLIINNSYSNGSVTSTGTEDGFVGGFIGYAMDSAISKVFSNSQVTGVKYVGGGFGAAFTTTIIDSYFTGSVTSTGDNVGNLVGMNDENSLERIYVSVGSANNRNLELLGPTEGSFPTVVQNAYLDSTNNEVTDIKYFTSKQMRDVASFKALGWDFTNVWAKIDSVNNGMPILRTAMPFAACKALKIAPIYFGSGKSKLTTKTKKQINAFASKIAVSPCMKIQINGHTAMYESGKKKTSNAVLKKIAAKRIQAVQNLLMSKLNAVRQGYEVKISNKYKAKQIASNKTEKGKAKNRRVVVLFGD